MSPIRQSEFIEAVLKKGEIDYLTITVCRGLVVRSRKYFRCEQVKDACVGIDYFNRALLHNKLLCFSVGIDDSCIKYDFALREIDVKKLYDELDAAFDYFALEKIKRLCEFFARHNIKCDNHVLGIRVSSDGVNKCTGICLYFRLSEKDVVRRYYERFIREISALFFDKPMQVYIPKVASCRLHMIALDFSKNEFKLKLYYEFGEEKELIASRFLDADDLNIAAIQTAVDNNGRLEFFQMALKEHGVPSYNLYFKPRE